MSEDSTRPRLLSGLLGLPAGNRERLSHVEIREGSPRTVACHFHQDLVQVVSGELAGDPSVSDQVAEVRQAGIFGSAIDVTRRDGVFTLRLWSGPYERAAWERRMAAAQESPAALAVLAAAGEAKAQQLRAAWAANALQQQITQAGASGLPGETVQELAQTSAPSGDRKGAEAPGANDLVRMPTGHSRPCVTCGMEAWHTLGSVPLHQAECLQLYLDGAARREPAVPVVEAPQEAPPSPSAAARSGSATPAPPAAEEETSPPPAPAADTPASAETRSSVPSAAPAVVLDVEVVGLPDGSEVAHPFVIDTLDKALALAEHYGLGVQVTKGHTEAGQVWVTAGMLEVLGLPVPAEGSPRVMLRTFRESTTGSAALVGAVQAGWEVGGASAEGGPSLGRWTWMRNGSKQVLLAAVPLMTDLSAQPLLEGDPSPGVLARRLALFAGGYGHPFKMSAQTSAFDYVRSLRWKERGSITEPQRDLIHEEAELDGNWTRRLADEEQGLRYLHAYDRSGSYVAGLSSKGHFGVGQPEHVEGPVTLERTTYGLVRLVGLPEAGDWRAPNPLHADLGVDPSHRGPGWRHTTTVRWAQELGYEPEILEAWIWPRTMPIFSTWYERVRDAREAFVQMEAADHPDGRLLKEQLKAIYTRMIGQMASTDSQGQPWFAPDRRWGIVAQSRVNLERLIHKVGAATADQRSGLGIWPVAWDNDTIVYASDEPDPHKAWPGEAKNYGQKIGQVHWEGSTLLEDHREFLTGGEWRGKGELTKDWEHGGERG